MNSICNQGEIPKENISFIKEIQMMMFGLGDSPTPLQSTAGVVEKVVLQQIVLIIGQAEEVAEKRGVDGIYPQDILFLLRKDVPKLNRVINHISLKEMKKGLTNLCSDGLPTNLEEVTDNKMMTVESKRRLVCVQFLQSLGVELGSVEDSVMQERLRRMDHRSQIFPMKMFLSCQQARRAAFVSGQLGAGRFLEWLRQGSPECASAIAKLKTFALDVLLYLAKETIAQLIDLTLVLRRDVNVCPTDPLSRAVPPPPCDGFPPQSNRVMEGPPSITPNEVREVLRRFYSPQLNPFSPFTCNVDPAIINQIITSQ